MEQPALELVEGVKMRDCGLLFNYRRVWTKGSTHCNFFHFPLDVRNFPRYLVVELRNFFRVAVVKSRVFAALFFIW